MCAGRARHTGSALRCACSRSCCHARASSTAAITITPSSFNPALNYLGKSQYAADPLFNGTIDDVNPSTEVILSASRDQLIGLNTLHSEAIHEDGTAFRAEDRPVSITLKSS